MGRCLQHLGLTTWQQQACSSCSTWVCESWSQAASQSQVPLSYRAGKQGCRGVRSAESWSWSYRAQPAHKHGRV